MAAAVTSLDAPRAVLSCDCEHEGTRLYQILGELYPICRSITGDGFRATLRRLQRDVPLEIREVASGTRVFDWTVSEGVEYPRRLDQGLVGRKGG